MNPNNKQKVRRADQTKKRYQEYRNENVYSSMTHPYSIYVWITVKGERHWSEAVQCLTEQWAVYVAGLIHHDSRSVIKVVRYGLNLACFPDEHAVELVERQIVGQRE